MSHQRFGKPNEILLSERSKAEKATNTITQEKLDKIQWVLKPVSSLQGEGDRISTKGHMELFVVIEVKIVMVVIFLNTFVKA